MTRVSRDQTIHVNITQDDYQRVRYYLMKKGHFRGGLSAFMRDAVREHLRKVEREPTTFEEAFMALWNHPPRALDKWVCYGAAIDKVERGPIVRQVGRFTIEELRMHHDTSRWDERTYVLVDEQIKQHRESGIAWNEQRSLIPPVPPAWVPEDVGAPQERQATVPEAVEAPVYVFDPAKTCFLGANACPQVGECLEAKGCCATFEEEQEEAGS